MMKIEGVEEKNYDDALKQRPKEKWRERTKAKKERGWKKESMEKEVGKIYEGR